MRFFVSDRILLSSLPIFPPRGFPLCLSPSSHSAAPSCAARLSLGSAQIGLHIGVFSHSISLMLCHFHKPKSLCVHLLHNTLSSPWIQDFSFSCHLLSSIRPVSKHNFGTIIFLNVVRIYRPISVMPHMRVELLADEQNVSCLECCIIKTRSSVSQTLAYFFLLIMHKCIAKFCIMWSCWRTSQDDRTVQ